MAHHSSIPTHIILHSMFANQRNIQHNLALQQQRNIDEQRRRRKKQQEAEKKEIEKIKAQKKSEDNSHYVSNTLYTTNLGHMAVGLGTFDSHVKRRITGHMTLSELAGAELNGIPDIQKDFSLHNLPPPSEVGFVDDPKPTEADLKALLHLSRSLRQANERVFRDLHECHIGKDNFEINMEKKTVKKVKKVKEEPEPEEPQSIFATFANWIADVVHVFLAPFFLG